MITTNGYSKDPSLVPEGIVITFGKDMMQENGGAKLFLTIFQKVMMDDEDYWMHKMSNAPSLIVADVYIICMNRLYGRCKTSWIEYGPTEVQRATGELENIDWQRLILIGPFERCPFKRTLKGFQGFRYCTKLF